MNETTQVMRIFFAPSAKEYKLVMQTQMSHKYEGETRVGKKIIFKDHYYRTSDQDVIDFIMKAPGFGTDIKDVTGTYEDSKKLIPKPVGPTVQKGKETEQESTQAQIDQAVGRVREEFKAQLDDTKNEILGAINAALKPAKEPKAEKPDAPAKTKTKVKAEVEEEGEESK